MGELPADLVIDGFWPVRSRQAGGFGGIRGSAECMRAHVADGYGLAGGSGNRRCGRSFYLSGRDRTGESAANFVGSVQFSAGERAGSGDGRAWAVIIRSFDLKQIENPLNTVRRPRSDATSIGFA